MIIKKKIQKVGVVVVTHNSQDFIYSCLKSIIDNKFSGLEIVVVDNASRDSTILVIKKNFKVKIIKNEKGLGFVAANNIGIKFLIKKGVGYILQINPDTISSPELVEKLLGVFKKDPKIGVCGCIITYTGKRGKVWFAGGYFNRLFCYTRHKFMDKQLKDIKPKSGYTDFITGACMMIDANIFKKIRFSPDKYFLYFEDVFFCENVKKAGFACFLLAEPLVSHIVSATIGIAQTNKMTPVRAYFFARNPLLYIKSDVKGYLKITNLIGQLFIRLPYYTYKMIREKNLKSIYFYYRGIVDSMRSGSSNFFLNIP